MLADDDVVAFCGDGGCGGHAVAGWAAEDFAGGDVEFALVFCTDGDDAAVGFADLVDVACLVWAGAGEGDEFAFGWLGYDEAVEDDGTADGDGCGCCADGFFVGSAGCEDCCAGGGAYCEGCAFEEASAVAAVGAGVVGCCVEFVAWFGVFVCHAFHATLVPLLGVLGRRMCCMIASTDVLILGSGQLALDLRLAFSKLGVVAGVEDPRDAQELEELLAARSGAGCLVVPAGELRFGAELELWESLAAGNVVAPSARAVTLGARRDGFRDLATGQLGLPHCRFAYAASLEELGEVVQGIGFPCVVKPIVASALVPGARQSICDEVGELAAAWEAAVGDGEVGVSRVLVEQYIPFDAEITVLAARVKDAATGNPATAFCEPVGVRNREGRFAESWQPAELSAEVWDAARSVAARIAGAIGGLGLFSVELFVKGEDVYFSAVSCGPQVSGVVTVATQRLSHCDIHARAVLGLPVDTTLVSPGAAAAIRDVAVAHGALAGGGADGGADSAGDGAAGVFGGRLVEALSVPEADVRVFASGWAGAAAGTGVNAVGGVGLALADSVAEARVRARAVADVLR